MLFNHCLSLNKILIANGKKSAQSIQARPALKRVPKACSEFHNRVAQPSPAKIYCKLKIRKGLLLLPNALPDRKPAGEHHLLARKNCCIAIFFAFCNGKPRAPPPRLKAGPPAGSSPGYTQQGMPSCGTGSGKAPEPVAPL